MSNPKQHTINVDSPHFSIRTLGADDAMGTFGDWLMDGAAQLNLNTAPRRLSNDEVHAYIASFDRVTSHIAGIFAKDTGRLVGIRAAYVDPTYREALLNTLIGEAHSRGKGAHHETRYAFLNFVFEDVDVDSLRASVVAENTYMLRTLGETGWICEHISPKPRANGSGFTNLHHFRLTRDTWRAWAAAKAKAHADGAG